jgi:hypothetical protein
VYLFRCSNRCSLVTQSGSSCCTSSSCWAHLTRACGQASADSGTGEHQRPSGTARVAGVGVMHVNRILQQRTLMIKRSRAAGPHCRTGAALCCGARRVAGMCGAWYCQEDVTIFAAMPSNLAVPHTAVCAVGTSTLSGVRRTCRACSLRWRSLALSCCAPCCSMTQHAASR